MREAMEDSVTYMLTLARWKRESDKLRSHLKLDADHEESMKQNIGKVHMTTYEPLACTYVSVIY